LAFFGLVDPELDAKALIGAQKALCKQALRAKKKANKGGDDEEEVQE
jgi:hypothetical protein